MMFGFDHFTILNICNESFRKMSFHTLSLMVWLFHKVDVIVD